mgnify:FL=1
MSAKEQTWMRLDNAAKIYPASMRRDWMAMFRLSATLVEPVEPEVLRAALARTLARFPWFAVRLRRGMFWYYLEHNDAPPIVEEDVCNPCMPMRAKDSRGYAFRVRYYGNRIAVEIFHVLTDGTGGLCFLKTLVAEYLTLRYGVSIPRGGDILDCSDVPDPGEMEDGFLACAGNVTRSRSEADSFHLSGTRERDGFIHVTTGVIPVEALKARAAEKGVSLTVYLTAVLILAFDAIQRRKRLLCSTPRGAKRLKPVKICVPVNLRRFFPTKTLRNFANYVNPGIEPSYGVYTLDEVLKIVTHQMGMELTPKVLGAKFTTNVRSEQNAVLRAAPLFLKDLAMRAVFYMTGDKKTATCFSNLGNAALPPEMALFVTRMEFMLGPLSRNPVAIGTLSYDGTMYINITRTIRESDLEREFFTRLIRLGVPVKIESNER